MNNYNIVIKPNSCSNNHVVVFQTIGDTDIMINSKDIDNFINNVNKCFNTRSEFKLFNKKTIIFKYFYKF